MSDNEKIFQFICTFFSSEQMRIAYDWEKNFKVNFLKQDS